MLFIAYSSILEPIFSIKKKKQRKTVKINEGNIKISKFYFRATP